MTAVLVLATLSACKDTGDASPPPSGATVPTAAPTTTTTNPYAVPAVIDAAYVNRVLGGLDAAYGDLLRLVYSTRAISPEVLDRLKALYPNSALLDVKLAALQESMRRGFSSYVANPGNVRSVVSEVISVKATCVFARVNRDYSAVIQDPSPNLRTQWIAIRPLQTQVSPSSFNPTMWGYIYEGVEINLQPPAVDPCTGI